MHARRRHQRVTHTPRVVFKTAVSSHIRIKNRMQILNSIKAVGGFVSEKIEIREGPFGSSLFSTQKINKDDTIMAISQRSIISVNSILDSGKLFKISKFFYKRTIYLQICSGIS